MAMPLIAALSMLILTSLLWLISVRIKDVSIVDMFWGASFVTTALIGLAFGDGADARSLLMAILVCVWGMRLTWHLVRRNWGKSEDYRYQAMRRDVGANFWWRSLFTVFYLQGALSLIIALPLFAAFTRSEPDALTALDWVGVVLWAGGLFFEAVGDAQLARFKANPANRGQVLRTGLWRYTRHPNYFGDAMVWAGLGLIGAATGAWWALVGPAVMTFFLVRVSGVALLEQELVNSKPGYADYVKSTSAFVPLPPRKLG